MFISAAYKISNVFRKLADMDESIVFLFIGCRGCLVLDKEKIDPAYCMGRASFS